MTGQDTDYGTSPESIVAALEDPQPSWITLPPAQAGLPTELSTALDMFNAGSRPAAVAASSWLKTQSVASHQTSRTRLLVADHRILGFYSLASAQVALSQRDRRRLGVDPVRVPAALVTWVAKSKTADIDGGLLLMHAAATARRVAALQATSLLVVDPFDNETSAMWRKRFGFRPSAEPMDPKRLWLPLRADD